MITATCPYCYRAAHLHLAADATWIECPESYEQAPRDTVNPYRTVR